MPDTTPADLLRAAADRAREAGHPLYTELGNWLEATAHRLDASTHPDWQWAVVEPSALAVARQLLGTTTSEDTAAGELEPVQLRWGLDDVMYGDDDTTTVLLSGPGREPYWVELDPERTAALRDALAGPAAPPAPADRAAILRVVDRLAAHAVGFQDVLDESDRGPWGKTIGADIAELSRLAGEAAAGVQQTATVPCTDPCIACMTNESHTPAVPEEPTP